MKLWFNFGKKFQLINAIFRNAEFFPTLTYCKCIHFSTLNISKFANILKVNFNSLCSVETVNTKSRFI